MDFCQNISAAGGLPTTYQPPEQHLLCSLDDLLSGHSMEDVNMEWLSIFVEDCLSSSGNCMPPAEVKPQSTTFNAQGTNTSAEPPMKETHSMLKLVVPSKARSKRKRSQTCWSQQYLVGKKCTTPNSTNSGQEEGSSGQGQGQGRKCTHCLSQRTPQWRAGPQGPKTLCNACGVRYKSGRLLPEYRPAKSPTFVSHKHSNSHKKVLEMRMTILPSSLANSSSSS
ncbi:GATA transcription factor 12-like [Cynara cardunculus var. scolymus]|uniref:Zinc finger, GATA-type n=1 Tax=Cynara cardunculus var. scolymus TaxID=59895 RepID=A0A124SBG9_CYNCS|nr:GATA transcription factor 12-like [Cynara cardunculus var. scolymus]KVH90622.1 Zinc finger, GATA-type [Cynara cardunculus var. scolymus]